eukprot:Seg7647.1 transcript_id=Seg7647.1/GoldUCD/mRNA.D3Y31 product=BUD13-like protein_id=Seg7647.1/GoldUCD/D3Y31
MAATSKLDYLKKYMSSGGDNAGLKGKRKKKHAKFTRNLMIIDNDVKFDDRSKNNKSVSDDEFDLEEEKPQVYVDGNTLLSELNEKEGKDYKERWAPVSKWKETSPTTEYTNEEGGHDHAKKRLHDSDNLFPMRSHVRRTSPDLSPKRSQKVDNSVGMKMSRVQRGHHSPDFSSVLYKKRHDSPDLSPKRSNKKRHDSPDISPKRLNNRQESISSSKRYKDHDSPKRSQNFHTKRHDSPDLSPKRLSKRYQSPDLSPQRHMTGRAQSQDLLPVRKTNKGSDLSPQRTLKRSSEQSPDLSPKRLNRSHRHITQDAGKYNKDEQIQKKKSSGNRREVSPEIVASGKKAGLQSAQSLREENIRRREFEDKRIAALENSVSGRGSGTVYRDKLRQQDEHEKRLKEDIYEMTKPLARYKDDEDLDEMLKQQERAEDPMLAFMRKNKSKSNEKKKEKPRYRGPHPPPNRFNIWPGYRWDGVDRSNGFEKKRFATIAEKQSVAVDAYKWSVEDM